MINYYTVLEISQKASKEQIKEAYKKISVRVHPDKNGGDEYYAEIFKTVNEAQQVLTDEAKRAAYDEELKRSFNYPFGKGSNYFGINFNLSRRWVLLLSSTAVFLTFVILLPSPDLQELEQQKAITALNSSNSFLKNVDRDKQIQQRAIEASNETGPIKEELDLSSHKQRGLKEVVALANKQDQQANKESTIYTEFTNNLKTDKSDTATYPPPTEIATMEESAIKPGEIQLNGLQMMDILGQVNSLRTSTNSNINCVKIQKTKSSNVENAFDVAAFFSSKGFIICGREIVYKDLQGVKVVEGGPCIYVTIGTY